MTRASAALRQSADDTQQSRPISFPFHNGEIHVTRYATGGYGAARRCVTSGLEFAFLAHR